MEEVFVLPTKRANVEIGSGSGEEGEEARKKAKTDFVYDFSQFTHPADFCEFYEDTSPQDPYIAWIEYENSFREKIRLREIQLFLKSEGREAEAMEIQSLNDQLARETKDSYEFRRKGWFLRTNLGPYTEYQRLYVDDICLIDHTGELYDEYGNIFCTQASDEEYLKLFQELQSSLTWDMSYGDAEKIVLPASKRYPHLTVETLGYAIREILFLKQGEEMKKELVPFFAKLWQETIKKERNASDVLENIKENNAALYPLLIRAINDESLKKHYLDVFERLKSGTKVGLKSGTKVAPRDEDLEDHIDKYLYPVRQVMPTRETYASYVKEKMKVAANLGLE